MSEGIGYIEKDNPSWFVVIVVVVVVVVVIPTDVVVRTAVGVLVVAFSCWRQWRLRRSFHCAAPRRGDIKPILNRKWILFCYTRYLSFMKQIFGSI